MKIRISTTEYQKGRWWPDMVEARRCCRDPKFRVLFIYTQDEILKTTSNMAYVKGTSAIEKKPEIRKGISRWFDIMEEDNAPIVQGYLDSSIAHIDKTLSSISTGRLDRDRSYDVHTAPRKELLTEIIVSAGTKDSVLLDLQLSIKNYLMENLLAEWAALTWPDEIEYWTTKAAAREEEIVSDARQCMSAVSVPKWPAW